MSGGESDESATAEAENPYETIPAHGSECHYANMYGTPEAPSPRYAVLGRQAARTPSPRGSDHVSLAMSTPHPTPTVTAPRGSTTATVQNTRRRVSISGIEPIPIGPAPLLDPVPEVKQTHQRLKKLKQMSEREYNNEMARYEKEMSDVDRRLHKQKRTLEKDNERRLERLKGSFDSAREVLHMQCATQTAALHNERI